MRLFKTFGDRRALIQAGDPPPRVQTPIAVRATASPGWTSTSWYSGLRGRRHCSKRQTCFERIG